MASSSRVQLTTATSPPPLPQLPSTDDSYVWQAFLDEWHKYSVYWENQGLPSCCIETVDTRGTSLREAQGAYEKETGKKGVIGWKSAADAYDTYAKAMKPGEQDHNFRFAYLSACLAYRYAWRDHWVADGQSWRTEPEIDKTRQNELIDCRTKKPDIEKGLYPFKGITSKLTRADVEWLLVTHDKERWLSILATWGMLRAGQANRGLDLRGADLKDVDLSGLPLAELRGGLSGEEWRSSTKEQREAAGIKLEGAYLRRTCFRAASLRKANLKNAYLEYAYLEQAALDEADLREADLRSVFVDHATSLDGVTLNENTRVADVSWNNVNLAGVNRVATSAWR